MGHFRVFTLAQYTLDRALPYCGGAGRPRKLRLGQGKRDEIVVRVDDLALGAPGSANIEFRVQPSVATPLAV